MIFTKTGFAELVGFSSRQVGKWLDEGMPVSESDTAGKRGIRRQIDSATAIPWLLQRAGENHNHGELQKARTGLIQSQAEKERMKVRQLAGELLEREDVEIVISEISVVFIRGLEDLPGRLVGALSDQAAATEVHAITQRETRALREQLSKRFDAVAARWHGAAAGSPARARKKSARKSANAEPKSRRKKNGSRAKRA